jgi:hypothetical protein
VFYSASVLSAILEKIAARFESMKEGLEGWVNEPTPFTWNKSVCKTCLEAAIKNKQVVPTKYFLALVEALDMTNID